MRNDRPWWQTATFYQIYPRSFQDSNGDGLGDLPGITARLGHLAGEPDSLGVDALWISPFYPSPMKDFGYDVSDYCDVDPRFGSLADFDALLAEAHGRGLRVIIDLVLNHTSDEHPWFRSARRSRDDRYHDWFLWHPGRRPNNWRSTFELHNAWWYNEPTDEYYLGTFTRHQPEVNWRNPELKRAMFDVMRFWLDRGVDGFRLDVVNWFIKDEQLRDNPFSFRAVPDLFQHHIYDRNRPESIDICREMRDVTDAYDERMMIGEVYADDLSLAAAYHGTAGDALHMAFNFNFLFQPYSGAAFARGAREWYDALPPGAWPNFTLSNHDQPRHFSRYAKRGETDARARVAAAMLLTLRGTPFLYYGEEIGMSDTHVPRRRLQDPLGRSTWPLRFGRDPERTPMQWDASANAGFAPASAEPWLPVNDGYRTVNAAAQREDPDSLLYFYRRLLRLRRDEPLLSGGEIRFLTTGDDGILVYERYRASGEPGGGGGERIVVALNFGAAPRPAPDPDASGDSLPADLAGEVLFGTHRSAGARLAHNAATRLELAPYEVVVLRRPNAGESAHVEP